MGKIILSINAGSSSVKISVYTVDQGASSPTQLAEAQIDGLTSPPPKLKYSRGGKNIAKDEEIDKKISSQDDAFHYLLDHLVSDPELSQISDKSHITHTCHRIVHGGDYPKPQPINEDTYHHLQVLTDLAPLHNGPALEIVKSCVSALPHARHIACFDSQFHATIPDHVRTYPINQEIARKNGLRKYGFHGISYSFITRSVASYLGKPTSETSIIALHLGSGASACAIRKGQSIDTTMGLTPLSGLPGATRSGNVDPSLVFHYASDVGKLAPGSTESLHISRAEQILNKESGWKSLTGTTDFGAIAAAKESDHDDGDSKAKRLAFDIMVDRVCGFVGSYFVALGGDVDALVFAGGIGEKGASLRAAVVEKCKCLGFRALDAGKNGGAGKKEEVVVCVDDGGGVKDDRGKRVLVVRTDEQFEMARGVVEDKELFGE
jgi:acetate kinase